MVNCDTMVPSFRNDYDKPDLKLPLNNLVFDRENFLKNENYKVILAEEDDYDTFGNKGCFKMAPNGWNLVILHNFSDNECDDEIE